MAPVISLAVTPSASTGLTHPRSRRPGGILQPCARGNMRSRDPLRRGPAPSPGLPGSLEGLHGVGLARSRRLPPGGSLGSEMRPVWGSDGVSRGSPTGTSVPAPWSSAWAVTRPGESCLSDGPRALGLPGRGRRQSPLGKEPLLGASARKVDHPHGGRGAGRPGLELPHIPHLDGGYPQAPNPEHKAGRSWPSPGQPSQ